MKSVVAEQLSEEPLTTAVAGGCGAGVDLHAYRTTLAGIILSRKSGPLSSVGRASPW